MADPPVKEGDVLAGKYQVERILGSGGMGIVVAAWHQELEQRVAVKFLLPEIAERSDASERFRREARAAVKIRSEHVARVLDVGTLDGVAPYMVMEYLDGHDLSEELRSRRMLPVSESVDFILQASEAVAEAHASGIVHRDLKPANLFVTRRSDGSRVVKVLDFGISKSVVGGSVNDLSLTRTSSLIGSPLYMSPEQMKSARDVDARTDTWALGAILFEMLAGRPPYVAETIPQLCAALLNESPPPLSQFRSDVPPALEAVILRCLAKDRTQRWASIAEFAQNLAAFGPASARIHADRARRVLGSTEISMTDPVHPAGPSGTVLTYPEMPSGTNQVSGVEPVVPIPPRTGATLASWGKTGDGDEAEQARKRRLMAVFAGAFGVAGVVVLIAFLRGREPEPPAPAPVPTAAAAPAVAAGPVEAKTVVPEVTPAPKAAAELPDAAASATPSASVAAQAKPAPHWSARRPGNPPKASPDSQQSKSVSSSISDFGGRR